MTFSIHFRIYIQSYIFLLWPFFRSIFHSQLELIIIQMIGVVIAMKIHIYLAPKEKQWFIAETEFASFLSELLFLFRSCFIFKNHMPCFLAIRFFSRYRIARMYIRYNQTWRVFRVFLCFNHFYYFLLPFTRIIFRSPRQFFFYILW